MPSGKAFVFSSGSSLAGGSSRHPERRDDYTDESSSQPDRNTKRTGQACTRCKSRKIKCDAGVDGCKPCQAAGEICETVDRNSGATVKRSHTADLALELHRKADYIEQLHAQLRVNDIQPIDPLEYEDDELPQEGWKQTYQGIDPGQSSKRRRIETHDDDAVGERFLGDTGNEHLSVIQGSRLTLFDHHFNFFDFFPPHDTGTISSFELTEDEYNDHIYNCTIAPKPEQEDYETAKQMARDFFLGTSFFTPIIHRPTFYNMLRRKYEFKSTLSEFEHVIFIMVMSIARFQCAMRGFAGQESDISVKAKQQLLYCLNKYNKLIRSKDPQALQALALMCVAMRALRRPGPAWEFCDSVLGRAVTLGYHIAPQNWLDPQHTRVQHLVEMRQRIFWSIMVCYVNISGNLGRPMRLDRSNIDVGIPDPSSDYVKGIDDETAINTCSWKVAPHGFRLTWSMMGVYSNIGATDILRSTRKANAHRATVELEVLAKKMQELTEIGGTTDYMLLIPVLYLKLALYSTSLLIRHPRYLRAQKWEISEENMEDLHKTSRKILDVAEQLQQLNSLDTTVYYNMNFIYAIFVELYVGVNRARQSISVDQEQMQKDMARWDNVLKAVGAMIGTADQLASRVQFIVNSSLEEIARLQALTASTLIEIKKEIKQESKPVKRKSKSYSRKSSSQNRSPLQLTSGVDTHVDAALQPDTASLAEQSLITPSFFNTLPQGPSQPMIYAQAADYRGYEHRYSPTTQTSAFMVPIEGDVASVRPPYQHPQPHNQHMHAMPTDPRQHEFINQHMPTTALLNGHRPPGSESQSWDQYLLKSSMSLPHVVDGGGHVLGDETNASLPDETSIPQLPVGQQLAMSEPQVWPQMQY